MNYAHPDVKLQQTLNEMAKKEREALPKTAFVFPDRRAWPIHDEEHAKIALKYIAAERGDEEDWPVVLKAVLKRYPEMRADAKALGLFAQEEADERRQVRVVQEHSKAKKSIRESLRAHMHEQQAEVRHGSAMVGFRIGARRLTPTVLARVSSEWVYDRQAKKSQPQFEMTLSSIGEQQEWLASKKFESVASKRLLQGAQDEGRPAQLEWQESESPGAFTGLGELGLWKMYNHGEMSEFVIVRADTDEIAGALIEGVIAASGLVKDTRATRVGVGMYMLRLPAYESGYAAQ